MLPKPEDLFQPLFSRKRRQPSRREYVFVGVFCAAMALGSWLLDVSKGGAIGMGLLAVGCFNLAARARTTSVSTGVPSDSAAGKRDA